MRGGLDPAGWYAAEAWSWHGAAGTVGDLVPDREDELVKLIDASAL